MNTYDKTIAAAMRKMTAYSRGNIHDINHFVKVHSFARTIGLEEDLDDKTRVTLELAAILHDVACPLCRVKYGNTHGPHQEKEGMPITKEFLSDFSENEIPQDVKDRIVFLVGHHHTYSKVEGQDYQILLEADFLVNAGEDEKYHAKVLAFRKNVFKTKSGISLLDEMYIGVKESGD